jgi:hypothetical protein
MPVVPIKTSIRQQVTNNLPGGGNPFSDFFGDGNPFGYCATAPFIA